MCSQNFPTAADVWGSQHNTSIVQVGANPPSADFLDAVPGDPARDLTPPCDPAGELAPECRCPGAGVMFRGNYPDSTLSFSGIVISVFPRMQLHQKCACALRYGEDSCRSVVGPTSIKVTQIQSLWTQTLAHSLPLKSVGIFVAAALQSAVCRAKVTRRQP